MIITANPRETLMIPNLTIGLEKLALLLDNILFDINSSKFKSIFTFCKSIKNLKYHPVENKYVLVTYETRKFIFLLQFE
jgi:hypothetical protein